MLTSKVYSNRAELTTTNTAGLPAIQPISLTRTGQPLVSALKTLLVLFKFRVVVLLLLAAVGGAFLGAGGWPGNGTLVLLVVTGGLAASGASAINQYLEKILMP